MTMDELNEICQDAMVRHRLKCGKEGRYCSLDGERRAGIRAVVEALRDAVNTRFSGDGCDRYDINLLLNEILASDGVEAALDRAVYGMSVSRLDGDGGVTRINPAEVYKEPAAPDVCEWTQESWEYRKVGCNGYGLHVYSNNYQPKRGRCPYCKLPVQIKSEAAR